MIKVVAFLQTESVVTGPQADFSSHRAELRVAPTAETGSGRNTMRAAARTEPENWRNSWTSVAQQPVQAVPPPFPTRLPVFSFEG